jgi:8-oxo-dGTP pyrophosphatase MutT (NUDIX family)
MQFVQSQLDEAEEQALVDSYGPTEQRHYRFALEAGSYAYWQRATALARRAEVAMVVQRPDGRLLVHTKAHYPLGAYRLPSGGIHWGEPVLEALAREQWEELGLRLPPVSMPGLVRYTFHHDGQTIPYATYLFVLQADQDPSLAVQDLEEPISDFCWIEPADMPAVADHLRGIVRAWGRWGAFRAIVHDLVAETI